MTKKSNQHVVGSYVHIQTNYKVSMTVSAGEQVKLKVPKWLPFENYKSESLNI